MISEVPTGIVPRELVKPYSVRCPVPGQPLGLDIPFSPKSTQTHITASDAARLVPQKHANIANKQRPKDRLLVLIWVLGDRCMRRQYGAGQYGVGVARSVTVPKFELCVLNCETVAHGINTSKASCEDQRRCEYSGRDGVWRKRGLMKGLFTLLL